MVEAKLESLIARLENAVARQEVLAGGATPVSASAQTKTAECKTAKEFIALIAPKAAFLKQKAADLGVA